MIPGHVLAQLRLRPAGRKLQAYQLESGRWSITRQVGELDLRVLLVDSNGATLEPDAWDRSRIFRVSDQEGLLVADNQTTVYTRADFDRRMLLARYA